MNPKEMAEQIVLNLWAIKGVKKYAHCKDAGIYTVQLIINANPHSNPLNSPVTSTMDYWMDVKGEIEKM